VLARFALSVPLIVTLCWAAGLAFANLRADMTLQHAAREMATWNTVRPVSTSESWSWMQSDLQEAESLDPRNPVIQELLGVLNARRVESLEYLGEAVVHFSKALSLRPVSPYSWANLAEVKYRMGVPGKELEPLLRTAARLGPWEPVVQQIVADFGLAVWDEINGETRAAVEQIVANGMRRNPLAMLQISERRGRLQVACRHLSEARRTPDAKWTILCESTEATQ
jgi:hypothetical protein